MSEERLNIVADKIKERILVLGLINNILVEFMAEKPKEEELKSKMRDFAKENEKKFEKRRANLELAGQVLLELEAKLENLKIPHVNFHIDLVGEDTVMISWMIKDYYQIICGLNVGAPIFIDMFHAKDDIETSNTITYDGEEAVEKIANLLMYT